MKAFEVKRLLLATLVASLPIACGTESPMGPSGTDASVSALRSAPLPPTAPLPPGPDSLPEAPSPNSIPAPEPASPDSLPVPEPAKPLPTAPNTAPQDSAPQDTAPPQSAPQTVPPQTDPQQTEPNSAPQEPAPATTRPQVPPPAPAEPLDQVSSLCGAAKAEITILRGSLPQPLVRPGALLELLLIDANGKPVGAEACRGIVWTFGGQPSTVGFAAGAAITVSANTRLATVDGPAGSYMIVATAPNGLTAELAITLP